MKEKGEYTERVFESFIYCLTCDELNDHGWGTIYAHPSHKKGINRAKKHAMEHSAHHVFAETKTRYLFVKEAGL